MYNLDQGHFGLKIFDASFLQGVYVTSLILSVRLLACLIVCPESIMISPAPSLFYKPHAVLEAGRLACAPQVAPGVGSATKTISGF